MLRYEYRQQMFQIVLYDKLIRLYIKRPVSLSLSKTRCAGACLPWFDGAHHDTL
jgi:hypothetical protein